MIMTVMIMVNECLFSRWSKDIGARGQVYAEQPVGSLAGCCHLLGRKRYTKTVTAVAAVTAQAEKKTDSEAQ